MNGTTPALLKAQSSWPKRSIVAATSFSTSASTETFVRSKGHQRRSVISNRFAAEIEEITVG